MDAEQIIQWIEELEDTEYQLWTPHELAAYLRGRLRGEQIGPYIEKG